MNIVLWVVSALLAAMYAMAGFTKLSAKEERLRAQFPWVGEVGLGNTRLIGLAELLGAVGLILPWLTGILPLLTPLAALGLVLVQVGAIALHLRRRETQILGLNVALLLAAAFVAVFRFTAL